MCSSRGEEDIGKKAAERAMEAEPWRAGAHVAMAKLYASKGQWCEAARERNMMKQKGVVKGVGKSTFFPATFPHWHPSYINMYIILID
jgi:hypothetical protein